MASWSPHRNEGVAAQPIANLGDPEIEHSGIDDRHQKSGSDEHLRQVNFLPASVFAWRGALRVPRPAVHSSRWTSNLPNVRSGPRILGLRWRGEDRNRRQIANRRKSPTS